MGAQILGFVEARLAAVSALTSRSLPLLNQLRGYSWSVAGADIKAGATVAAVSLPQAIGFALIAGLPPQMVVASLVIGGAVAAVFNSSRHAIFGPTNTISVLLAGVIYSTDLPGLEPIQKAVLIGFIIGILQLAAGLAGLGNLTQFVSRAVVVGYTTGVAVLITLSQLPHLLGFEVERGGTAFSAIAHAVSQVVNGSWSAIDAGVGVTSLLVVIALRRFRPHWPDGLILILLCTPLANILDLRSLGLKTVQDLGALSASFPSFSGFQGGRETLSAIPALMNACLAIAVLGMLEAVSISKTLAGQSGHAVNPNSELIGMGAGNLAASLFGAMPGSASFVRSSLNYQSGGRTQVSAIIASGVIGLGLVSIVPMANLIPVSCLAALVLVVAVHMVNRPLISTICRSTRSDAAVFGLTFAGTILLNLDTAIYVGIASSLALFLRKASSPVLVEYSFHESGHLHEIDNHKQRSHPGVSIVHIEGDLFFGAADLLQFEIGKLTLDPQIRVVILRMKNARHLDATTALALEQLVKRLRAEGRHLLISSIHGDVARVLKRSGLNEVIGIENIFPAEANVNAATRRALKRACELLETREVDIRIFHQQEPANQGTPSTVA